MAEPQNKQTLPKGFDFQPDDQDGRREFERARGRIGDTLEKRMKWLIGFSRAPLEEFSTSDLLQAQYEAAAFALTGMIDGTEGQPRLFPMSLRGLPSDEELQDFQGTLRQALEAIPHPLPFGLFFAPVSIGYMLRPPEHEEGDWELIPLTEGGIWNFDYVLAHLLRLFAKRIHQCPECQTIFLADRLNQDFCSKLCQARIATRRYRERHGLVTGRKRGRPPKINIAAPEKTRSTGGKSNGKKKRR